MWLCPSIDEIKVAGRRNEGGWEWHDSLNRDYSAVIVGSALYLQGLQGMCPLEETLLAY